MKTITFHVSGTHCNSCKILIEDILNRQVGVKNTQVDLDKKNVSVEIDFDGDLYKLAEIFNEKLKDNGYFLSVEKINLTKKDKTIFWKALPIGIFLLALFFIVQKSGILNFGLGGEITPTTSLIIGAVASVSSCLAVVGGLVLSLSATVSRDNLSDVKPMMLFHIGRLSSFTLLGGLLGVVGGVIGISFTATSILGIIASLVMIILGLNLVGVFERNKITIPSNIFNLFRKIEHKTSAPFWIGFGTFFLPCGFTQAMQVVALSSGSFISGALIMGAFSLGTLPMLALLSFGSNSFSQSKYAPIFFQTVGVVVIGLGAFSLLAGLAGIGIISPLFNI